ncbi:MAG: sulfate adenylyltransferase, partial [Campylobacterota bacterium]|nr:sulfate adenylyltransferase [Campylobacterota bacterium]
VLENSKKGDKLELINKKEIVGHIIVDEIFPINKDERIYKIYGTNNPNHKGVQDTYKRLGDFAICGEYTIYKDNIIENKNKILTTIEKLEAKEISAMVLSAEPFHRVHERLIRTALVKCDLLVIFIKRPYELFELDFNTRYQTLKYFIDNFLPKDRVLLVTLDNTYIFGGLNELLLNAIVAKNYLATKLIIGQNHAGLGAYWEDKKLISIVNRIEKIGLEIEVLSEFVYCDKCRTLVSTNSCPHGSHHHVKYHNESIIELLKLGIIPPAILMRKEISSVILSSLFPNKKEQLRKIHQNLSTSSGIIDEFKSEDFYDGLMNLYQTSSLT